MCFFSKLGGSFILFNNKKGRLWRYCYNRLVLVVVRDTVGHYEIEKDIFTSSNKSRDSEVLRFEYR